VKRIIVLLHPAIEIIRLAGVEFSGLCGAEDVHEEQICPPLHSGRKKAETLSRLFLQSSPKRTLCVTMRACFEESGLTKKSPSTLMLTAAPITLPPHPIRSA
jgi:hypothetical protein